MPEKGKPVIVNSNEFAWPSWEKKMADRVSSLLGWSIAKVELDEYGRGLMYYFTAMGDSGLAVATFKPSEIVSRIIELGADKFLQSMTVKVIVGTGSCQMDLSVISQAKQY